MAFAAAFVVWIATRPKSEPRAESATASSGTTARAVSLAALRALAFRLGRPVYWAGPRAGTRYELTQAAGGRVYIRYLPPDVKAGDPRARFLTIGTYSVENAFSHVQAAGRQPGAATVHLAGDTIAVYNRSHPTNIYLATPGSPVEVEVYHPSARMARQLAVSGAILPLGPSVVSAAALRSLASSRGRPLYWAGPRAGMSYELTQAAGGRVYIRYLPPGVKAGDPRARFLTIGTYSVENAFSQVQAAGRQPGAVTTHLADRAIAIYNRSHPTHIYLATPGSPVEVEIYHPDARTARRLALEEQVAPVG